MGVDGEMGCGNVGTSFICDDIIKNILEYR